MNSSSIKNQANVIKMAMLLGVAIVALLALILLKDRLSVQSQAKFRILLSAGQEIVLDSSAVLLEEEALEAETLEPDTLPEEDPKYISPSGEIGSLSKQFVDQKIAALTAGEKNVLSNDSTDEELELVLNKISPAGVAELLGIDQDAAEEAEISALIDAADAREAEILNNQSPWASVLIAGVRLDAPAGGEGDKDKILSLEAESDQNYGFIKIEFKKFAADASEISCDLANDSICRVTVTKSYFAFIGEQKFVLSEGLLTLNWSRGKLSGKITSGVSPSGVRASGSFNVTAKDNSLVQSRL